MDDLRKPDVVTVLISRVDGGATLMRVVTTEYRPTTDEEKKAGLGARTANWTIDPTPEYVEKIIAKHDWQGGLRVVSWEFVDNDIVNESTDRIYRNAWKANGKKIEHDMVKAKEIHRERLRAIRAPLLEDLDVEYQRADEKGDQQGKKKVADKKQLLRDVTDDPAIEAATTIEELKQAIPAVLKNGG